MGIYTMPNPKTELTSLYSFPQDFRASSTLPCRTTPTRRSPVKLQPTDHPYYLLRVTGLVRLIASFFGYCGWCLDC